MKAWMEMIQTWRRISCAAMVIVPKPVTIDVAVNMTTMDETLRSDRDKPLCMSHIQTNLLQPYDLNYEETLVCLQTESSTVTVHATNN